MNKRTKNSLAVLSLFILAFAVRYVALDLPMITFDEFAYVSTGYRMLTGGDAFDESNIFNYDSPPVGEYIYGLTLRIFGSYGGSIAAIRTARLASVFLGSLTVVLVYQIGKELYNFRVGVVAGLFLTLMPLVIAHNKIATLETPLAFFTTLSMWILISRRGRFSAIWAVIISAFAFSTKYLGLASFITIGFYLSLIEKKSLRSLISFIVRFTPIFLLVFYLSWPFLWNDTISRFIKTITFHSGRAESFFIAAGENIAYTLVQTPEIILIFALVGVYQLISKRTKKDALVLLWLSVPYLLLFALRISKRSHYFFQVLPALAVVAGIGVDRFLNRTERFEKIRLAIIFVYLISSVVAIHPWYLDYYNVFVGGVEGVYLNNLFEVGYYGEGLGKAMEFLDANVEYNSYVQFYVEPNPTSYPLSRKLRIELPKKVPTADYVVVNTDCVRKNCVSGWLYVALNKTLPEPFNITYELVEAVGYKKVFEVGVGKAVFVRVYKLQ